MSSAFKAGQNVFYIEYGQIYDGQVSEINTHDGVIHIPGADYPLQISDVFPSELEAEKGLIARLEKEIERRREYVKKLETKS